jgi:hypothetical protein
LERTYGSDVAGVRWVGVGDVNSMSSPTRSRSVARADNAPRPLSHHPILRPPDVTADATPHLCPTARPASASHHHVPHEIGPNEERARAFWGNRAFGCVYGAASALLSAAQAARGDPPFKGHLLECILQRTTVPLAEHIHSPSPYLLLPMPVPWLAGRPVTLHSLPRVLPPGVRAGLRGNASC